MINIPRRIQIEMAEDWLWKKYKDEMLVKAKKNLGFKSIFLTGATKREQLRLFNELKDEIIQCG